MAVPGGPTLRCVHRAALRPDLVARQLEVKFPPAHPPASAPPTAAAGGGEGGGGGSGEGLAGTQGQQGQQQQQQPDVLWVNHYHYTAWPDHGVPPSTAGVRALCHALDDCRRAGSTIAVHCSAGVGRTGAFVAIDMLLQRLQRLRLRPPAAGAAAAADARAAADVRALVLALRRQRRGMVQTGAQYEFVYHALVDDLRAALRAAQSVLADEAEEGGADAAAAAAAAEAGGGAGGGARGQEPAPSAARRLFDASALLDGVRGLAARRRARAAERKPSR